MPDNVAAYEVTRWIQQYADQLDQWLQMVNAEDILKQKLMDSLYEIYFKSQRQVCINYANRTLAGLIQHLYDDHRKISPMNIEESGHTIKQEWSLLDPMVYLFEKIE